MSWAKFDDLYDDNRKVKRAWRRNRASVGLHAMAITYCSRHDTDGIVDEEWLEDKLPAQKERDRVIGALIDGDLFEAIGDGTYRVHDYLEFNGSSTERAAKREEEHEQKSAAGKKGAAKRWGKTEDASANSTAVAPANSTPMAGANGRDSSRAPSPPGPIPAPSRPSPTPPARGVLAMTIAEVETVLRQCSRLHVDRVGLENAVGSWPGRDPVQAARTVVTWATDPAFRTTNAAKLLGDALSKQPAPATRPDGGDPDLAKYDRAVGLA